MCMYVCWTISQNGQAFWCLRDFIFAVSPISLESKGPKKMHFNRISCIQRTHDIFLITSCIMLNAFYFAAIADPLNSVSLIFIIDPLKSLQFNRNQFLFYPFDNCSNHQSWLDLLKYILCLFGRIKKKPCPTTKMPSIVLWLKVFPLW